MYQLSAFDGMTYDQAVQSVLDDPATTYSIRQRIQDDARRDPLDCLTDAEVHHALTSIRVRAILRGPSRNHPVGELAFPVGCPPPDVRSTQSHTMGETSSPAD